MNIQNFLTHFNRVKHTRDNQYMAQCPSHDDRNNSLSIKYDEHNNTILVNCHAGCRANEILEKVGLKMKDLYNNNEIKTEAVSTITYKYYDENGEYLYKKVRTDYSDKSKKIYFEKPNGEKTTQGIKRVLYNLPEVIKADKVYIVEGEKCADAINKLGLVATTLACGANSKWSDKFTKYFKNKQVIIIPDNDKPGMMYAENIKSHIP